MNAVASNRCRFGFGFWEGGCVAFETTMLRCSAAVAVACPCIPKAVVRLGRRAPSATNQDDPRVLVALGARRPLVNDLGPEFEVKERTPFLPFFPRTLIPTLTPTPG